MPESAQPRGWGSARTDALVAIALFAVAEAEVALTGLGVSSVLAAAAATLPLALRRRAPVLTVLFVVSALALGGDWADKTNAGFLVLLLASYSVGAYASRTRALVGAGVLIGVIAGAVLFEGDGGDLPFVLFMVGMPWLAGRVVRRYRERAQRLEELAEHLESERVVRAQLAVAEERGRMAAELNDAVGHAVSTMVVQAGAAEEMLVGEPERARPALAAVQQTGREAIHELRATLGVLRDDPPQPAPPEPPPDPYADRKPRWARRLGWSPRADVVLAISVLALGAAYAFLDGAMEGVRIPVALVQLPAAAAIAIRSLHSFPALLLALFAMVGESILISADPESPAPVLAVVLALYSVAAHADRSRAAFGAALGIAVPCVVEVTADNGDLVDLWVIAPALLVPWLAGRAVRASRRQADRLRLLTARLERERDARVRLALVEEHTRIARELHDSIAHAVSVMVLQAGAAEQVLDSAPERAREAIQAVQRAGRQALAELGRTLGLLAPDTPAPRLTALGLGQLDDLLATVRRAGLPVELHVLGEPTPLPARLDGAAYRVIQEGLTNALKHAGAANTTVTIRYSPDGLRVEILDDGVTESAPTTDAGHGLIGMRERVAQYGGKVQAGRRRGASGFAVSAFLPYDRAPT
jgi:signal transduction histidine kinase